MSVRMFRMTLVTETTFGRLPTLRPCDVAQTFSMDFVKSFDCGSLHRPPDSWAPPTIEIRCYVLNSHIRFIRPEYRYQVRIGDNLITDRLVFVDNEHVDESLATKLSISHFLPISELEHQHTQCREKYSDHHQTYLRLENEIQAICYSTLTDHVNGLSNDKRFLQLCADFASSMVDTEFSKSQLIACVQSLSSATGVPLSMAIRNKPLGLTANISSLPSEILMEIFLLCLPDYPRPARYSPPLSLTHVCSSWRKIALSMPELWSSMTLDISFQGDKVAFQPKTVVHEVAEPRLCKIMDTWVHRARPHLLRWQLIIEGTVKPISNVLRDSFISHCSALETLAASFCRGDDPSRIFGHASFPNLTSLNISCRDPSRDVFRGLDLPHRRVPRLTRFSAAVPYQLGRIQTIPSNMPWANITHLDLIGMQLISNLVFSILKVCKNLQEGSFYGRVLLIVPDGVQDPRIIQTRLRSFTMIANPMDMKSFPDIEYSSLERFVFEPPGPSYQWNLDAGERTFHSFRHARFFTLGLIDVDNEPFLSLLRQFTKLETLVLRFRISPSNGFLERFFQTLTDYNDDLLPMLKHLCLYRCPEAFPVIELLTMVQSRSSESYRGFCSVSALESVSLHFFLHCPASQALSCAIEERQGSVDGVKLSLEVNVTKHAFPSLPQIH